MRVTKAWETINTKDVDDRESQRMRVQGLERSPKGALTFNAEEDLPKQSSKEIREGSSGSGKPRTESIHRDSGEVPGGPAVRTLRFHCQGRGFILWLGN